MFEIHTIDGKYCPVIVCDICGERILDASHAALIYRNFEQDGTKGKALHVHKDYHGKNCHSRAEALIEREGGRPGWVELTQALADMAHNTGVRL